MHTCSLYSDCVTSLQDSIKAQLASDPNNRTLSKSHDTIINQVKDDVQLLSEVKKLAKSVKTSKEKFGFLRNLFISTTTGRISQLAVLEAQLLTRIQLITALLTKDATDVRKRYIPCRYEYIQYKHPFMYYSQCKLTDISCLDVYKS